MANLKQLLTEQQSNGIGQKEGQVVPITLRPDGCWKENKELEAQFDARRDFQDAFQVQPYGDCDFGSGDFFYDNHI